MAILIWIILFIYLLKFNRNKSKLKPLTSQDFPDVDSKNFDTWKKAELRTLNTYRNVILGSFLLGIFIGIFMWVVKISANNLLGLIISILYMVILFIGLSIAALFQSKAKKIKIDAGIIWPKKPTSKLENN